MDNQENEDIKNEVDLIVSTAESMVIGNNSDLEKATEFIKEIKTRYKSIESFYEPMVASAKQTYDTVRSERDKYLKPLKQIESEVKDLMNNYNNKMLQIQRAEAERIAKEKEENRQKLIEAERELANGNENAREKIEELLETTSEDNKIEAPKISGMSTRIVYVVNITDLDKVPKKFNNVPLLELSKLGKDYLIKEYKIAKALKQDFNIDGIEVKEEVTTVVRR